MRKLAIAVLSTVFLCSCNAAKSNTTAPHPEPYIPIAEADSPAEPAGWTFQSQTVNAGTIPVDACLTDFSNLMSPNTMPLPSPAPNIFNSCALQTDIPLPTGQSNWLQTIVLGAPTAELYSGEAVYYIARYDSADGSTSVDLGGQGTFTTSTTVQGTTTAFNYQISGPINCLTINNSVTAACAAWQTTFTATVQ